MTPLLTATRAAILRHEMTKTASLATVLTAGGAAGAAALAAGLLNRPATLPPPTQGASRLPARVAVRQSITGKAGDALSSIWSRMGQRYGWRRPAQEAQA
jgi:hypothetical protein